ncbi:hypothetical protein [Vibrio mediterranei]|uniref:hypothetical protein n=1 Tax=Vibrio mediterranei TaxID=689 RepID=UPI004068974A
MRAIVSIAYRAAFLLMTGLIIHQSIALYDIKTETEEIRTEITYLNSLIRLGSTSLEEQVGLLSNPIYDAIRHNLLAIENLVKENPELAAELTGKPNIEQEYADYRAERDKALKENKERKAQLEEKAKDLKQKDSEKFSHIIAFVSVLGVLIGLKGIIPKHSRSFRYYTMHTKLTKSRSSFHYKQQSFRNKYDNELILLNEHDINETILEVKLKKKSFPDIVIHSFESGPFTVPAHGFNKLPLSRVFFSDETYSLFITTADQKEHKCSKLEKKVGKRLIERFIQKVRI